MKRIWDGIVAFFLAAVAYWKGRVDQEDKDKKATLEVIEDAEKDRTTIEDRIRNADPDERERMRDPWYRDK